MIASRGVVCRSILSWDWISRGQNMANGWEEKKKKERAVRDKRKNRRCRRQEDVRVSSGKASSGVYYYLFDDQRRMWATSPRCTSPLISDNPLGGTKKSTHIHTRFRSYWKTHTGRLGREIRPVTVEDEREEDAQDFGKPISAPFFIISTMDERRFHFLDHQPRSGRKSTLFRAAWWQRRRKCIRRVRTRRQIRESSRHRSWDRTLMRKFPRGLVKFFTNIRSIAAALYSIVISILLVLAAEFCTADEMLLVNEIILICANANYFAY